MQFMLLPGKCKSFNSINDLLKNEFNVDSINEVKWKIQSTTDGNTVFIKFNDDERILTGFKPKEGFVDLIECNAFPI